ncbi:ImmA/IrrE family metallo-endopeptidase [Streptomyces sp. NPDC092296]|uniref:ImmA/IrrE family metallo-endopeptidase n=1 Tax=Streptomyces sp. NPDC092296 TaxID=3366012 RepID=UPI003822B415
MTVSNWEMKAGDPADFAFKISFLRNPHGEQDRATPEESYSWGSFALWVAGENLCAHLEQGEVIEAAHWYMIPFMEWIAQNWNAIFHEEQLALKNVGYSAAGSMALTKNPPISLKELDEFEWLDEWTTWWDRHSVRSAREGGLFPDIYMRRYGSSLEVSTGAERLVGIPEEFSFLAPHRRYEIDLIKASDIIYSVLQSASQELLRRLPNSPRIAALIAYIDAIQNDSNNSNRMAWLAGMGTDSEKYKVISEAVDQSLAGVPENIRQEITGANRVTKLVVQGSAYAQLVYGSYSPSIDRGDVIALATALVGNHVDDASPWLNKLALSFDPSEVRGLAPGEQGSWLGEHACEMLVAHCESWIDVHAVLASLEILHEKIALSDQGIRAVSVFGPNQRPKVFRNSQTKWGKSREVERFTLAHELAHLLLDRDRASELAVASGPWAPLFVEQRANAFAAAFLMPTWLLRDHVAQVNGDIRDLETISSLAARLHVSTSSMIDRLHNLGELDVDDRFKLKARWRRTSGFGP